MKRNGRSGLFPRVKAFRRPRLDTVELLHQLNPHSIPQLFAALAIREALRRYDGAVRKVLSVGVCALGARVDEGAAALFGGAGEDTLYQADGPRVIIPIKLAVRHAPAVSTLTVSSPSSDRLWGRASLRVAEAGVDAVDRHGVGVAVVPLPDSLDREDLQ